MLGAGLRVFVLGAAIALAGAGSIAGDSDRGVLQVTIRTNVTLPPERYEVLIGPAPATSDRATLALLGLVAGVWPNARLELLGSQVGPSGAEVERTGSPARIIRASFPGPLTDGEIRAKIDAFESAANTRPAVGGSPRIAGLADGYASCASFVRAASDAAASAALVDARALGSSFADAPEISDVTQTPRMIDGPRPETPLCSTDAHLTRATELPEMVRGAFTDERIMRVVRSVRFAVPASVTPQAPSSMSGPSFDDGPLVAEFPAPVLTLDGDAYTTCALDGMTYTYRGPIQRHFTASVSNDGAEQIRRRLVRLGLPTSSIEVHLSPSTGNFVVAVHTTASSRDDAIVRAIAGDDPVERAAVQIGTTSAGIVDDTHLLPSAVADAASRARRIASLLGARAETRPLAVAAGPSASCGEAPSDVDRRVAAAFRIDLPHAVPTMSPETAPDWRRYSDSETKLSLPSIVADAPFATEARRELKRPADAIRIRIDVSPDNAHDFRPIPRALVANIAADLGVAAGTLDVSVVQPVEPMLPGSIGAAYPPSLRVVTSLADRGATTSADILAVERDVEAVGYGSVSTVTERYDCSADADLLARDTVLAALAAVPASRAARVIGIELHGPYVADGSCRAADAGRPSLGLGPDPEVRFDASARMTYR